MEDSILVSVRIACGLTADDDTFDDELIALINSDFMELYQVGIGVPGFMINDASSTWSDLNPERPDLNGAISVLVGRRVRMVFDPPTSATVRDSLQKTIDRLEVRLNWAVDPRPEEIK